MENIETYRESYINKQNDIIIAAKITIFFLADYFIMPQYFGIQIAGFDMTAQRIGFILLLLYIMENKNRVINFCGIIAYNKATPWILIYMLVLAFTMVIRVNVNTFMYSFIEFLCFYLLIYIIKDILGVKKFIEIILKFVYLLCILGIIEFIMQRSLFSYLNTIPGLYTGQLIRSGSYRIMGPCNHSLAYGLLLITVVPLACLDQEKNEVNILQNKLLLILLGINILLTGSRSTLAIFGLEILLLICFSPKKNRKKAYIYLFIVALFLSVVVITFYNTFLGRYIMNQLMSVIDAIFGTQYAVQFGADITALSNSSNYRKLLLQIFQLEGLNPLVGKGSNYVLRMYVNGYYIKSIDNFYIAQYIRYAYPGLITYVFFMLFSLINMIYCSIKYKSGFSKILLVGSACYFINLWWLDTLQTIKYVYILFALFYVVYGGKTKTPIQSGHLA